MKDENNMFLKYYCIIHITMELINKGEANSKPKANSSRDVVVMYRRCGNNVICKNVSCNCNK